MRKYYLKEIEKAIRWLNKNKNKTPNVGLYIGYFLECSRLGGVFDIKDAPDKINKLYQGLVNRIKEKEIIKIDNDFLFRFLRYCRKAAIEGIFIPEQVMRYSERVADNYLKFMEHGNEIDSLTESKSIACNSIDTERKLLFKSRYTPDKLVTKMFDYVDSNSRVLGRIELFERYNEPNDKTLWNFYESENDDDIYTIYMRDVKLYIYPQLFIDAISSSKAKINLNVLPIYVQSLILLEYHQPFDEIIEFIRRKAPQDFDTILNEIVVYSKRGVEFYKYVCEKLNRNISKDTMRKLDSISQKNKEYKSAEMSKSNKPNDYSKQSYDCIKFKTRKEEIEYLSFQTDSFKFPGFIKSGKENALIYVGQDKTYLLPLINNKKKALVNLYCFSLGLAKPKESCVNAAYDYLNIERDTGYPFIEISNNNDVVEFELHIPSELSPNQIYQLENICKMLTNSCSFIKSSISIENIKRAVSDIKEKIEHSKSKSVIVRQFITRDIK